MKQKQLEFIRFEGSKQFKEKAKFIIEDPISVMLNHFLEKQYIKFEEIAKLKIIFEKGNTTFNSYEIIWIINNYKIWFNLLKAYIGRNIFLEFYRYSNNVYSLSKKLKTTRRTTYKWTERLLKHDWLFVNTSLFIGRTSKMLVLNKNKYPNLMLLTRYFILNKISEE